MGKTLLAYAVHVFTALGAACGLGALIAIWNQQAELALWLLGLAIAIDGLDGTLARKAKVKRRAQAYDGALLDNIIDGLNWVYIPLFWAYAFLDASIWVILVAAVVGSLGMAYHEAKTSDNFFRGFPNYWNLVVVHAFLLKLGSFYVNFWLIVFAAGIFAPIYFIYPSRAKQRKKLHLLGAAVYTVHLISLMIAYPNISFNAALASLAYPFFYLGDSIYQSVKKF
jgi:phosphatidylcholine synthase